MNSMTYISDPTIWEAFYKNMAEKKFNPYKYKPNQRGRGWSYKKSYRIPVRPHSKLDVEPIAQLATPLAAVEERVKEEYKKDVKEGNPHVTPGKGIKRKTDNSSVSSTKKRRGTASQTKRPKAKHIKKVIKTPTAKIQLGGAVKPTKTSIKHPSKAKSPPGRVKGLRYRTLAIDKHRNTFDNHGLSKQ